MLRIIFLSSLIYFTALYAQWSQTNGPYSGMVRSFVSDGSNVYFGLGGGGIHKSVDNGTNWFRVNDGLLSTDIKVLQYKDSMIFAGTDEGVYRSVDLGSSWKPKFNGLRETYIKCMTICGNDIYAGTYVHGIFKSSDNGDSWTNVYTPGANYVYILDNDGTNIYAATYGSGVLMSPDGGQTWQPRNNGLGDLYILTVFSNPSVLLASTAGNLYRSVDGGLNWTLSTSGQVKGIVEKDGYIYIGFFGSGVSRSNDLGLTWTARNTGLSEKDLWSIGVNGTTLFAGVSSGNVYRSVNGGGNWSLALSGIVKGSYAGSLEAINAIVLADSINNKVIAGTHGDNLHLTSNEGATWTGKTIGTVEIRALESVGELVFCGTDMLGAFLSQDYGITWNAINTGLTSKWIQAFAITDRLKGEIFLGTGEKGLFFTNNGAASWTTRNNGLTSGIIKTIAGSDPEMYIGTGDAGFFYSANYGLNWTQRNNGLPTNWIQTIILKDSLIFAGTGDAGVYISSNKGVSWSSANNGLNDSLFITSFRIYNDIIIAGTKPHGVFISRDNGGTWKEFNLGLTNKSIASIEIFDGHLYAGSIGSGVFKRPLGDLEVLGTPVNLTISTDPTSTQLSWDNVPGAFYYRIYRSENPYSGFVEIDTSPSAFYEDTGIMSGNKYFYQVTADNSK